MAVAALASSSPFVSAAAQNDAPAAASLVYFGTYSQGDNGGVFVARLDTATGELSSPRLAAQGHDLEFLAVHPNLPRVYAVGKDATAAGAKRGAVFAYTIDPNTGMLALINSQTTDGAGFCHVSLDHTASVVLAARYNEGNAVVLPLASDGSVQPVSAKVQHRGSGPNRARQEKAHAHAINVSPDNRFAFVSDLGTDEIYGYVLDLKHGTLEPNTPPSIRFAPGSGPRQFAFHPTAPFAFAVCELDQTVVALNYDAESGRLAPLQTIEMLPEEIGGEQKAAEIVVHPNGRFLYASNRGHDALVVFAIDPATGHLTFVERYTEGLSSPRNFAIDPSGRWLLCANQAGNSVHAYAIDPAKGTLARTGAAVEVPAPVCIRFFPAEAR